MLRERGDSISFRASMVPPNPSESYFLTNHLWNAFLEKTTSDVTLNVTGSWKASYNLHKVVIIQSGFFKSLFTAGFAESGSRRHQERVIAIAFDDENITRAAFEFCIARLYGGGLPIFIPSWLKSSPSQPLTSCYPWDLNSDIPFIHEPIPPDHQPGTPAFLLSLLATSVYLSIPTVASQAISAILTIIGPHTVLQFLNFACGKPITQMAEYHDLDQAAVGLESIAEKVNAGSASPAMSVRTTMTVTAPEDIKCALEQMSLQGTKNDTNFDGMESVSVSGSISDSDSEDSGPGYHYGSVSDKIGEACVCWLARWGIDSLIWEEMYWGHRLPVPPIPSHSKSSPHHDFSTSAEELQPFSHYQPNCVPLIWSSHDLSPHWINALFSADTFFAKGEKERYDLAKRVIELRRRVQGIREKDEKSWKLLFEEGIYYANMSMDDIMMISQDLSPTTNQPYVSLPTLQGAHWDQSLLRHRLMSSNSTPSSPFSSPLRTKDLGVCHTEAEITSTTTPASLGGKFYYSVPTDASLRLGDAGISRSPTDTTPMSMDHLFEAPLITSPSGGALNSSILSSSPSNVTFSSPSAAPPRLKTSQSNFFGLTNSRQPGTKLSSYNHPVPLSSSTPQSQSRTWSPYPPLRIGVEFFDVDCLKEKSRLHSQTIWYAGSLFNVYTQIVRKKASGSKSTADIQTKMGIYLHRQSSVEIPPPASAPSATSERVERERQGGSFGTAGDQSPIHTKLDRYAGLMARNRGPSLPELPTTSLSPGSPTLYSPISSTRSNTPGSTNGNMSSSLPTQRDGFPSHTSNTLPATVQLSTPPQPFRDPRASISAYFAISCASATGTSQTRFTSSPDEFAISQSWGWTSSSLRTEEYIDTAVGDNSKEHGKEVSLRATVVLGLV